MKFVVIEIKTTGMPGKDGNIEDLQIIEFGAIIEDTNNPLSLDDIPRYNKIIRHEQYSGGAFAINLNARIFEILAKREIFSRDGRADYDNHHGIIKLSELANDFFQFLYPHFSKTITDEFTEGMINFREAPFVITPAGKNFDVFDRNFIKLIPNWDQYVNLRHRTIDPTSMYVDWENDDAPPGLGLCMERAGIMSQVTHKADIDAFNTLKVIRKEYNIEKLWMRKN